MNNTEYVWECRMNPKTRRILSKSNELEIRTSNTDTTAAYAKGTEELILEISGTYTDEEMKNLVKDIGWTVHNTEDEDVLRRTCENCSTILDSESDLNYVVDECNSEYQLCNECAN